MTKRVIQKGIALIALIGLISTASATAAVSSNVFVDDASIQIQTDGTLPPGPPPGGGEEEN
jgi:hypothetical protein